MEELPHQVDGRPPLDHDASLVDISDAVWRLLHIAKLQYSAADTAAILLPLLHDQLGTMQVLLWVCSVLARSTTFANSLQQMVCQKSFNCMRDVAAGYSWSTSSVRSRSARPLCSRRTMGFQRRDILWHFGLCHVNSRLHPHSA